MSEEGLAHSDTDGIVYCHMCDWSRQCGPQEDVEFQIVRHLKEFHYVRLQWYRDDVTGERKAIPR